MWTRPVDEDAGAAPSGGRIRRVREDRGLVLPPPAIGCRTNGSRSTSHPLLLDNRNPCLRTGAGNRTQRQQNASVAK
jgi:hypothetical protein